HKLDEKFVDFLLNKAHVPAEPDRPRKVGLKVVRPRIQIGVEGRPGDPETRLNLGTPNDARAFHPVLVHRICSCCLNLSVTLGPAATSAQHMKPLYFFTAASSAKSARNQLICIEGAASTPPLPAGRSQLFRWE